MNLSNEEMSHILKSLLEVPIFKFALREDLAEDTRFYPVRGEPKASGWDVRAAMPDRKTLIIRPLEHVKIPLGFRGFCPDGWWYDLKPRSSTFAKKHLHSLYGTIDETYEGELVFACQYIPPFTHNSNGFGFWVDEYDFRKYMNQTTLQIDFGDAIGQLIPRRREEMIVEGITNAEYDEECKNRNAHRGAGGFGSTGK